MVEDPWMNISMSCWSHMSDTNILKYHIFIYHIYINRYLDIDIYIDLYSYEYEIVY